MSEDTSLPEFFQLPAEPTEPMELADDDFVLPPARGRASKVTVGLATLALLAVGFLGGALVQKHAGTSSTSLAARAGRARAGGFGTAGFAGLGEGFGGSGLGGPGTAGGGTAGGGADTTGSGDAGTTAAGPGPVAIGTVVSVSGTTLVVKDLGGHTRTLTIGPGATLSTSAPFTATALTPGQSVTVDGTTGTGGAVTVTTIVRRS